MSVVITEKYNVMVTSKELTGTTEHVTLYTRCRLNRVVITGFDRLCFPLSQSIFKTISWHSKKYAMCFNENDKSRDNVNLRYLISQSGPFSDVNVKNRRDGMDYVSSMLSNKVHIWSSHASRQLDLMQNTKILYPKYNMQQKGKLFFIL
jgi:hypothetical protein